ncbi:hypothetical protein ACFV2H_47765 [Streptomyces sp. NPDC059629]|uniref:VMAP-C domain-containing protein n=1 Tax=Streptomyces sp. NPDC059629 TaxID=3346889 RepID=UPI00367D2EB8
MTDCLANAEQPPAFGPWPQAAPSLLLDVLLTFQKMSRLEFRQSVLEEMGRNPSCPRIDSEVREDAEARAHVTEILRTIASRTDPFGALESLRNALHSQAPFDGALPWLELTVLGLTRPLPPLTTEDVLTVIAVLRRLSFPPRPAELSPYLIDGGTGHALFTGRETLPEILVRLADRRDDQGARLLLHFLQAFSADEDSPAHSELAELRELLAEWDGLDGQPEAGTLHAEATRLIVQIRLEAEDPAHISDGRYSLYGAYYRQSMSGGPMRRVGTLRPSEPLAKSDLIGSGSTQLAGWTALARELRSSDDTAVRLEFLLPSDLLGHAAELWSPGVAKRPLGHHHPVVVRSLERYADAWLDAEPWRRRWSHLQTGEQTEDAIDRIGWPALGLGKAADLAQWLADQPTVACIGLDVPYDGLDPELKDAVDDAMFTDGVPVLLWRRNLGDRSELVAALREYSPRCLTDLPHAVHHCRRHGRKTEAEDVRNNITLLWDDPYCVDPDQDSPYVGMA